MSEKLTDLLESLVDEHGLLDVVEALETICALKAAHIEHSWQDYLHANRWESASRAMARCAANRNVQAVS
jgi:hypothetical protein